MAIREFVAFWIFHWCPEKAIYISGHPLLWDARCAGIYTGFGAAVAWALLTSKVVGGLPSKRLLIAITGMFFPFALDVLSLFLRIREPSNEIRFLTGILFGAAFSCYVLPSSMSVLFPRHKTQPIIESISEYSILLLVLIEVYLAKALPFTAVFYVMNAISIFGFSALVLLLTASILVLIIRTSTRMLRAIRGT
jgi:uncharacterized membrane protein